MAGMLAGSAVGARTSLVSFLGFCGIVPGAIIAVWDLLQKIDSIFGGQKWSLLLPALIGIS